MSTILLGTCMSSRAIPVQQCCMARPEAPRITEELRGCPVSAVKLNFGAKLLNGEYTTRLDVGVAVADCAPQSSAMAAGGQGPGGPCGGRQT